MPASKVDIVPAEAMVVDARVDISHPSIIIVMKNHTRGLKAKRDVQPYGSSRRGQFLHSFKAFLMAFSKTKHKLDLL